MQDGTFVPKLTLFTSTNRDGQPSYPDSFPLEIDWIGYVKSPYQEVIHPQVLLRIPCYDLAPVNGFTLDPLYCGASSAPIFHSLTGGEYKTQEHIHRDMLIHDY
jgi:hypothetical protein